MGAGCDVGWKSEVSSWRTWSTRLRGLVSEGGFWEPLTVLPGKMRTGIVRGKAEPLQGETMRDRAPKNDQWEQGQGEKRLALRTAGRQTLYC